MPQILQDMKMPETIIFLITQKFKQRWFKNPTIFFKKSHRFTSNVWSLQNHRLLHGALGHQQSPKARSIRLRHGNHPELEGYRLQRCVFLGRQHVRVFCCFLFCFCSFLLFGSSRKQIGDKTEGLNHFFLYSHCLPLSTRLISQVLLAV